MPDLPRLNPAIRALESGKPAFVTFSPAEIGAAQSIGAAAYDGVVFEMEHNPYDIRTLRDCMQYMLDRAQILKSGSLAPAVAPMVRIPPNGGEMNQFIAKQVPGIGVVLIGEGDLSQDMGYPRQYEHPEVAAAIDDALAICKEAGIPCGHPHVDSNNVEQLIEKGFRWLMPAPSQSFAALDKGLRASGRK